MSNIACMGGFCASRDKCRLYHARSAKFIAERLCEPGRNDSFEPVRVVQPPNAWRKRPAAGLLAPATWLDPVH